MMATEVITRMLKIVETQGDMLVVIPHHRGDSSLVESVEFEIDEYNFETPTRVINLEETDRSLKGY